MTVKDVLDARKRLLRARVDQARARYDYLRDLVALRMRAGQLDLAAIREFNSWLQAPAAVEKNH